MSEWISLKDALPDVYELVLMRYKPKTGFGALPIEVANMRLPSDDNSKPSFVRYWFDGWVPTHWTPLPTLMNSERRKGYDTMTLAELTTPYKRRRVIEYGADGNKPVRHWYEMQQVDGTIYKSKDDKDGMFVLAVFLDDKHDGYHLVKIGDADRYTVECVKDTYQNFGYSDIESFIAKEREFMNKGCFVGNAEIEFLRQYDPSFADTCAKYRERFYERKHKEDEKRRKAQEEQESAKEAAEEARRQADLEGAKAKYLGWADDMTPMRFGKVNAVLSKRVHHNGKVTTRREFVIELIRGGYTPEQDEGVTSWYGSKWEPKQSKPKTEYYLLKDNRGYKVTKTGFDFATYLVSQKVGIKEGDATL